MKNLLKTISFQLEDLGKHFCQLPDIASGVVHGNIVPAYWCIAENFGDLLTPTLLRHYGFTPIHFYPFRIYPKSLMASTGSILDFLPDCFRGIILGSGFMHESTERSFPLATVLAVRGRLSLEKLSDHANVKLGDPGLLASLLHGEPIEKKWKIGVVPHYVDLNSPVIKEIGNKLGEKGRIINVRRDPLTVIREIDACECILSSSLHGLIVADSLKIPNRRFVCNAVGGGDFKYMDYYSVFSSRMPETLDFSGCETIDALTSIVMSDDYSERWQKADELKSDLDNLFCQLRLHRENRNAS